MLSCTCIIILQALLNCMPHYVLLFNILSGTTLLLGILSNERQHSLVWLHSMLCLNLVSFHRSPLLASELYLLWVFQRRALTFILALQCGFLYFLYPRISPIIQNLKKKKKKKLVEERNEKNRKAK